MSVGLDDPTSLYFSWTLYQSVCGRKWCELVHVDETAGVRCVTTSTKRKTTTEYYLKGCPRPFLTEEDLYEAWRRRDQERWVRVDEHGLRIVDEPAKDS